MPNTILPFLRDQPVFEPEVTNAMFQSFQKTCQLLKLNGDARAREAVAERIVELVQRGEHDPERLCERILREANGGRNGLT